MKRIKVVVIGIAILLGITVGTAQAWDICVKDPAYATKLYVSLDPGTGGLVINGQAIAIADSQLIGAITGCIANGPAFAIGYLNERVRYYLLYGSQWYTWGINGNDSTYYDNPRPAEIVPCGVTADEASSFETGASD